MPKDKNGILKVKDMRLGTYLIALMLVMCLFSCGHQQSNIYSPSLLVLEDSLETMPEKSLRQILDMDTTTLRKSDKVFYYYLLVKAKMLVPDIPALPDKSDLALSHFAEQKDSSRLCQLYFFLGRIYAGRYAFLRANAFYNQAEKFAGQNIRMLFAIKVGEAYIYLSLIHI